MTTPDAPPPSFKAPAGGAKGWSVRRKIILATVGVFVGLLLIGTIFGEEPSESTKSVAEADPATKLSLAITSATVKQHEGKPVTAVRGSASPGATIVMGAKTLIVDPSGNWAMRAGYDAKRDDITVKAALRGETTTATVDQPKLPHLEVSVSGSEPVDIFSNEGRLRGRIAAQDGSDGARGTVRNVRVTVNGRAASVDGSRWSAPVSVSSGTKTFRVAASKSGYDGDQTRIDVRRRLSKAEKAARAAAAKQRWMASATSIPFGQLDKNPDRYSGDRVTYRGQIFQIQEDFGSTMILLSVTDEGYGFWTDEIMVTYDGTTEAVEDDIVTIYGTVEGSETYDTRIGGENTVAKIEAKYIVR